jgi:hypothetical protein
MNTTASPGNHANRGKGSGNGTSGSFQAVQKTAAERSFVMLPAPQFSLMTRPADIFDTGRLNINEQVRFVEHMDTTVVVDGSMRTNAEEYARHDYGSVARIIVRDHGAPAALKWTLRNMEGGGFSIVPGYVAKATDLPLRTNGREILRFEFDRARASLEDAEAVASRVARKPKSPAYLTAHIAENQARTLYFRLDVQLATADAAAASDEVAALEEAADQTGSGWMNEQNLITGAREAGVTVAPLDERSRTARQWLADEHARLRLATAEHDSWAEGFTARKGSGRE